MHKQFHQIHKTFVNSFMSQAWVYSGGGGQPPDYPAAFFFNLAPLRICLKLWDKLLSCASLNLNFFVQISINALFVYAYISLYSVVQKKYVVMRIFFSLFFVLLFFFGGGAEV